MMTTTKDPIGEALDGLRAAVRDLDRAVTAKLRTAEAIETPPELTEAAMAYADAWATYSAAHDRWVREHPEERDQGIDVPGWKAIAERPCLAMHAARDRMCAVAKTLWAAKRAVDAAAAPQQTARTP